MKLMRASTRATGSNARTSLHPDSGTDKPGRPDGISPSVAISHPRPNKATSSVLTTISTSITGNRAGSQRRAPKRLARASVPSSADGQWKEPRPVQKENSVSCR